MQKALQAEIRTFPLKLFIGKQVEMCFANNKVGPLWRSFMPVKNTIENVVGSELYSIEVFHADFFEKFDAMKQFQKWAAVEVENFASIPADMDSISLEGLYAVFLYKGAASEGHEFFQAIFQSWLPNSLYRLDDRPHFAIMGDKYKNEDPDSEEEICIPIKLK